MMSSRRASVRFVPALALISSLLTGRPGAALAGDYDADGVPDAQDMCPRTTNLNGPVPTSGVLCDGCIGDATTILGCNPSQILDCKSGPNRREYEQGLKPQTQHQFLTQRKWAATCTCDPTIDTDGDGAGNCVDDCPDDPLNTTPGPLGCGHRETTGVVVDGQDLVLEVPGGRLGIPAGALPAGVDVTLAEIRPLLVDSYPALAGEPALSNVIEARFSERVPARLPFTMEIAVPESAPARFHARIRTEQGFRMGESSDSKWHLEVGEFTAATRRLAVPLFATAGRILLYVATRPQSLTSASAPGAGYAGTDLLAHLSAFFSPVFAVAEELNPGVRWDERPWAVVCDPEEFTAGSDATICTSGVLSAGLAGILVGSDEFLTSVGLVSGVVKVKKREDLVRAGFPFMTAGDARGSHIPPEYMVAELALSCGDDVEGMYSPADAWVCVRSGTEPTTAVHELVHAAQEAAMPDAWQATWVTEGTAAAIEGAFLGGDPLGFRYGGVWRDWSRPLHAEDAIESLEYQTAEFWLHAGGGSANFLAPFFTALQGAPPAGASDYQAIGTALDAALGSSESLSTSYLSLIAARNSDFGYPLCETRICDVDAGDCSKSEPFTIDAVSAFCADVQIINDRCPGEPVEVTMRGPDGSQAYRLMVDGDLYPPNETVSVGGDSARLWLINSGRGAAASETLTMELKGACKCGNAELDDEEECDDGNVDPGDGCDEACKLETDPFVDAVVTFAPVIVNGQPTAFFANPTHIIGPPNGAATTLGDGGTIVVAFRNNYLSGDGTSAPDLRVQEIGPEVEWTEIRVFDDVLGAVDVGLLQQQDGFVDLDRFGLGVDSRIRSVRIRDRVLQGSCCHDSVGADVDYVQALTSHPICPEGAVCRE